MNIFNYILLVKHFKYVVMKGDSRHMYLLLGGTRGLQGNQGGSESNPNLGQQYQAYEYRNDKPDHLR